jgi:hypothetical protein
MCGFLGMTELFGIRDNKLWKTCNFLNQPIFYTGPVVLLKALRFESPPDHLNRAQFPTIRDQEILIQCIGFFEATGNAARADPVSGDSSDQPRFPPTANLLRGDGLAVVLLSLITL